LNTNISKNKFRKFLTFSLILIYIIVALIYQQYMFNEIIKTNLFLTILGGLIVLDFFISPNFRLTLKKINQPTSLVFILFGFLLLNSVFIRNYFLLGAFFNLTICSVIGVRLSYFKLNSNLLLIPFLFLTIYILYRLTLNLNPEFVFLNSRNYISFYLIINVIPYYLISFKNNLNPSYIPSLITVVLSFYSFGRAGIVSSILILISVLIFYNKGLKLIYYFTVISSLIGVLITVFLFEEFNSLKKFSNLENFLSDGGRSTIVSSYLNNLDFFKVLLGVDVYQDLPNQMAKYGHVHSSFINFHSAVGIGSLIFGYHSLQKLYQFFKINKSLFFLFMALIIRASTDVGLLFGYFDYIFWIFLFSSVNIKKASKLPKNYINEL
jgi:hypothetical protein